jgi:tetratricopeptide (TPR) repeat protein
MKKIILFVLIFTFSLNLWAQNNQPSPLDATNWGVVYDVAATKQVTVKKDVPYSGSLTIDVYSPPNAKPSDKFPAVIFLNAIGDAPDNKVKNWAIYKSFPRLIAAYGMVGISMDADGTRIQECLRELFVFLEKDGAKHGIDSSRLGVYAASANTTQSLVYLMGENVSKNIKAAALFYGATPTAETRIRKDLPVLYILAEGDAPGFFGQQSANLWQRVMEAKAPWTLLFASNLPHAFDAFTDNDESRRVIQQAIAFWKSNLEPVPQPDWKPSPAREIVSTIYWNDAPKAVELLSKYIADHPNDGAAYNQFGRMLAQLRRYDEAGAAYEQALKLGVSHGGIYNGLGQTRMAQKRYEEAANYLAKAIELGARSSLTYGQLAFAQMNLNRHEEAIKTYQKAFEAGIPPGPNTRGLAYYNMACAYARLKQIDKAFEMLGKAIDEGLTNRNSIETDTDLAPLRSDARFQTILAKLPKSAN